MGKFYIFGLQRSGTTFLENLITLNFHATVANKEGSWKHSLKKPSDLEDHKLLCVFKNPYTWLESIMFRDPADLLVTATDYNLTDNSGYTMGHDSVNLENLCRLYVDYCAEWSETKDLIKYEDLLVQEKLDNFLSGLDFERKTSEWLIPEPGSLFMSEGFSRESYGYYLNGKPKRFNKTEIDLINKIVTNPSVKNLGYDLRIEV